MTLHTPNKNPGSSRYCGPTAIMAVTGLPGSDVRDAVRQVRGDIRDAGGAHMPVMGMSNTDLLATMAMLGWSVVQQWASPPGKLEIDRSTYDDESGSYRKAKRPDGFKPYLFSEFLRERGSGGPFIVNVTGHYMAVSHGEVCDAYENFLPREIDRYLTRGKPKYRNAWVWKWWLFAEAS